MELVLEYGYVHPLSLKLAPSNQSALGIPYEIVALNVLLTYWTDRIPVAVVVIVVIILYS